MPKIILVNDYLVVIKEDYSVLTRCNIRGITGNCKVAGVTNLGMFLKALEKNYKEEEIKDAIKIAFRHYITIFATVTNLDQVKLISKYFDIYYNVRVPIGYYNYSEDGITKKPGYQYHLLLKGFSTNSNLRNLPCKVLFPEDIMSKKSIEETIDSNYKKGGIKNKRLKKIFKINS